MVAYTVPIPIKDIGVAMKTKEFQVLSSKLAKLTPYQRSMLADRLHKIEHVQAVSSLIESRVLTTPLCPKCGHERIAAGAWTLDCSVPPCCLSRHLQRAAVLCTDSGKAWMHRFHGIATHYLVNYLGWRRIIDRAHGSLSPRDGMLAALGKNGVQQLTVT